MSDIQPGLTLILGGARAGKTRLAERLAARHGERIIYLATAEPRDDEMRERIARHRSERPQGWRTLEAPLDPVAALRPAHEADAVLLDCVTVWTSNLLLRRLDPERIDRDAAGAAEREALDAVTALLAWQAERATPLYAVSNEVGLGVVPPFPLGRVFQDTLGRINQRIAASAERVYLVVAGLALELRALGATDIDAVTGGWIQSG